jgi:4,5-dihydroxyphthalate decarboxylase
MPKNISLTLACGDYEIVRALKEGVVNPEGIDLTILTNMDSSTRNWRFLRNQDFDAAEVSSVSHLMAKDLDLPFEAIPVFLHRRFRHGFVFVNTGKGIRQPKDLIGRRVGVKSFQVSSILWMRGILEHEYDVPLNSIEWFSEIDEDVEFEPPPDLRFTCIPDSTSCEAMLVAGNLDAVIHSNLIDPILEGNPKVGRLFPDHKQEEIRFFRKTGIFPIMHVLGIRQEIVQRHPWVPINLYKAFNEAKSIGMNRMVNPRIVPLAWYREAWEEEHAILGDDPWQYGMTEQNQRTLELIALYAYEQGLIKRRLPLDKVFLDVSEGRKRGGLRI